MIAKGGTATVYRALDNVLNREVAVKVLHEHLEAKKEVVNRFKKEAQLIAQLHHPNIVTAFDFLEHQGRAVVVVEFMPGTTLSHLVKTVSIIHENYVLMMAFEILQGLRAAHQKGMIHRDIKPANILVHPELGVKISDFGLAKITSADDGLTKDGIFVGTPSFSSPEQIEGRPVDQRTDIFSLGLTLYILATRSHAFKQQGDSTTTVWFKIVQGKYRAAREINTRLSTEFENIINRSLEVSLDKRYPSADAMLIDVERLLKARGLMPYRDRLKEFLKDPERASGFSDEQAMSPKMKSVFQWAVAAVCLVAVSVMVLVTWNPWARKVSVSEPPVVEMAKPDVPKPEATASESVSEKTPESLSAEPEKKSKPKESRSRATDENKAVLSIQPSSIYVRTRDDQGPGVRISWKGDSRFILAKDESYKEKMFEEKIDRRVLDLSSLEPGLYFWKGGATQGRLEVETIDNYRARYKPLKRALVVSSQFGDVDLEINPWVQELKLTWQSGPQASFYRLELAADAGFQEPLFSGVVLTSFAQIERFWDKNQTLFWRVSYLDQDKNVFFVEPIRKINLTIKGQPVYFDVLSPAPYDSVSAQGNITVRAQAPQAGGVACAWGDVRKGLSQWTSLSTQSGFFSGKMPQKGSARWLICEGRFKDRSIYFSIPVQ